MITLEINPVTPNTIELTSPSTTSKGLDELSLELQWIYYYANFYTELTYNISKVLTSVDIYIDNTKVTKLFSKDFTYDLSGRCSQVLVTRISDGKTLTKTLTYDGSGYLLTATRVYSP